MKNNVFLTWEIDKTDNGQVLRKFLRETKGISRKALAHIKFKGGSIEVNGKEETVRYVLKEGDIVKVTFPHETVSEWIKPVSMPLSILYEDDHILLINKQPYLPTIPSRNNTERSLAGAVIHYYTTQKFSGTFHAINRLDKNTSGLMLVAKHRYIHDLFSQMQREDKVHRTYMAVVHGVITKDEGTIAAPIARKEASIIEREVSEKGQHAVTHYKVIERCDQYTFVELSLETGRTHQIRVHLSYIGHPLVGDTLYGGSDDLISRQALHSKKIRFFHPIYKKEYEFTCPPSSDIRELISLLKGASL